MKDNTNRHFHGQCAQEEMLYFTRKHPIILLKPFFMASMVTIFSLFGLAALFSGPFQNSLLLQVCIASLFILLTINHHLFFLDFFSYFLKVVFITNYRVLYLKKSLFIHDDKEIIDLHEIQDTRKVQTGLLHNFMDFGNLHITTSSMSRSLCLHNLPCPEYYLNKINETKRYYILDRRRQKFPYLTGHEHNSTLSRTKTWRDNPVHRA